MNPLAISNNEMIDQQQTISYGISHQTTPSGHLITQPKNVRHNQSFDNSENINSVNNSGNNSANMNNNIAMNNMNTGMGMNIHNMNSMNMGINNMNSVNINMGMNNINSNIPMDNGAYETIPDTFSPHNQVTGFNNMPANAFQVRHYIMCKDKNMSYMWFQTRNIFQSSL